MSTNETDGKVLAGPAEPVKGPVTVQFLLAGKARFTVSNGKGEHYTYRVVKAEPREGEPKGQDRWFVSLLTGPQNETDYSYLGMIDPVTVTVRMTKASKFKQDSKPVKVLAWALLMVKTSKAIPAGYAILHEGRCGRCGRLLTVPESIQTGIGPDCAGMMGIGG